jgi:hypothetical protein
MNEALKERIRDSARQAALSHSILPDCPREFYSYAEEWNREYVLTLFEIDCESNLLGSETNGTDNILNHIGNHRDCCSSESSCGEPESLIEKTIKKFWNYVASIGFFTAKDRALPYTVQERQAHRKGCRFMDRV